MFPVSKPGQLTAVGSVLVIVPSMTLYSREVTKLIAPLSHKPTLPLVGE